ncbi:MAG: biosynthetic-type acetolactate synthase large subunit [Pyrinomonadaceae bacterium]|nr:biosynthetic-type acetolactate synthase large subunit [Blastocatellia bacterium]MCW5955455.1 biosynthetic-type acetolactate synthase large subunit [Pyrinomonadaceae bacterium]
MDVSPQVRIAAGPAPQAKSGSEKIRGAEILIRGMIANGVDTIFGLPGGAVLHIYDELWRYREETTHYLVRHEQGAVHAAEGYARATGKVGVALVTSGPGATNAVTGIATAYMDSIPLVVITGQVPTAMIGTDAFQEVDTFGITIPIVKHSYLVRNVEELGSIVNEAFYLAQDGKPGPVVIDIPKDVTAQLANYQDDRGVTFDTRIDHKAPTREVVETTVEKLLAAQRPVFYVGGGVVSANAANELLAVVEKLNAPVTPTLMGLGAFPSAHPQCLGMLGMHGTYSANLAVAESDLLIAIGVRFDDRVTGKLNTFAPVAEVIHIDVDASNIGKLRKPQIPVVADAKQALAAIYAKLSQTTIDAEKLGAWWSKIRRWQTEVPLACEYSDTEIKPQQVIETLYEVTDGNAVIVTDVGQHQMWAAQFYPFKRSRQWLTSGGLGTMGFGLPAAMGAQIALPDETVVAVVGDGGFQMTNQEIITAIQYNVPLKVLIMNNGYLGMVRQWQEMFYDRAYSEVDLSVSPDFVKLAEAYGAIGLRASHPSELKEVLHEGLEFDGVAIMDIVVTKEENVFPIVPAGGESRNMILK